MNETLEHHGILGMKWGVRRYQNKDGTWTKEGKKHRAEGVFNGVDDYFSLSVTERVDSPIGKELLSGESYEKYASARDKQEEIENKVVSDKASDFYDTAHAVAENYKAKAGENYNQETYDYYNEIGGIDAYDEILNEYARTNDEYGKARKDEADAVQSLYDEAGPLSKKYFGNEYRLTYQDVNELAYERFDSDREKARRSGKIVDPVEAKGMFTKKELDAVANRNVNDSKEAELNELMLLEMLERSGVVDSISDEDYNRELSKFEKDPYNYVAPTNDGAKHSDDSTEESLMHYGILGMKWGIRRYQNKDGSLTAAGRKRYGDDIPDGNTSSDNSSDATPRTPAKSASEMTDQELNQALNRLRMEQQYNELTGAKSSNQYQNQQNFQNPPSNTNALSNAELQAYITRLDMEKRYAQLTAPPPKEVSAGRKFFNDVVGPAVNQVAKAYIVNALSKALGLKGEGDNGGNNNNNNNNNNDGGGKKKNKNNDGGQQQKNYDKQFNETNSRIDKLTGAVNNLVNKPKQETSIIPANSDNSSESPSSSGKSSRSSHRDSILSAAREAANTARENKKTRDELRKRLNGYKSAREEAREKTYSRETDEARRRLESEKFVDYYSTMWAYGM